jgi:endonuclease G
MKKLLLLVCIIPTLAYSQLRDSIRIKTSIYEVVYSEKLEEPMWIKYTVQCPNGTASRAGMDFYTNDSIHTSDTKDYEHNIYDKGHMAPAADFNCTKEMLYQTFSYLNCALQDQYLNRGVWRFLEAQERELAKTQIVVVTIQLKFDNTSIKLPTGATVPVGFYKTIYLDKTKEMIKYYFPNTKPTLSKFQDYKIK